MAKRIEQVTSPPVYSSRTTSVGSHQTRSTFNQHSAPVTPQGPKSQLSIGVSSQASSGPRNPHHFRNMSDEEYRKLLAAGTCFRCGLKFGPTHRCPPKTLQVLVGGGEDSDEGLVGSEGVVQEVPEENDSLTIQHLQLSELTSNRLDGYQMMKLIGRIGEIRVKVMIDSRASHCFVADHVATRLNWVVEPKERFSMVLGDGSKVRAGGICKDVPLLLDSELFTISCYVFPLSSVELILRVSWLAMLGDVKANWRTLTMEFSVAGQKVCLHGNLPSLVGHAIRTNCNLLTQKMSVGFCGPWIAQRL